MEKFQKFQIALFGLILGLSLIISLIGGAKVLSGNFAKNEIAITGSASEIVKSDSAVWKFEIKTSAPKRVDAYNALIKTKPVVKEFLKSNGVADNEIEFLGVNDYANYKIASNGNQTQDVSSYNYSQMIKINTKNVELVKKLHTEIPSLIEKGVVVSSIEPNYYYSNLSEKKAELLEKATADAKTRAKGMLKATHNSVGKIRSVKMGVFQITPPDSTDVSDWGINDSSTIDKKITAVANVVFAIR